MAETPNHGYNVPDAGTQDWHEPLNQNFEAFEVDIELRDTGGPTEGDNDYDPAEGAKYLDTATGEVYLGDGTTWSQEFSFGGGGGGGISSLTGGDGIDPDSIGDEETISVASGDLAGPFLSTNGSNNLTVDAGGGLENDGSGALQASLGNALGFDGSNRIAVTTDSLTVAGNAVSLGGSTGVAYTDLSDTGSSFPIPNADLDNSAVTVSAGNGLGNGGQVSLGGTTTLDVNPAGVAGTGLTDDGASNLEVTWGDAANLGSNGQINDFSEANDLDADGNVTSGSGGGIGSLSGGDGISPDSIGDGDTLSVAAGNALGADSDGNLVVSTDGIGTGELATPFATLTALFGDPVSMGGTLQSAGALTVATNEGDRALKLGVPAADSDGSTAGGNVLAGSPNNSIDGAVGAVVAGGGSDTESNTVYDNYGTVGGGRNNEAGTDDGDATIAEFATVGGGKVNVASDREATVGGGGRNDATARNATVGGGRTNTASSQRATVAGGLGNTASSFQATVGGGDNNTASGEDATVPGGSDNEASESHAFAAGRQAKARASGAFVWGDSSGTAVESTTTDEVVFQAGGGVTLWSDSGFNNGVKLNSGDGSWNSLSARASKTNVEPIDPRDVLAGVEKMSVSTWEYETNEGVTHMGPMAGQFHETFGLGDDPERISTVDADGVALAAIQGLSAELDERDERIDDLEATVDQQREELDDTRDALAEREEHIADLEAENEQLRDANEQLREQNTDLEARLAAVEDHLGLGEPGATTQGVAND